MPKDCPACHLTNPPDALRCDCGYDFRTSTVERSYLTPRQRSRVATVSTVGLGTILALFVLFRVASWLVRTLTSSP
jgi:hypothetical protein